MATRQQLIDAARKAHAAGAGEDARRLLELAMSTPPEVAAPSRGVAPFPEFEPIAEQQEAITLAAEEAGTKRAEATFPNVALPALERQQSFMATKESEREKVREAMQRTRQATITAEALDTGIVEPAPGVLPPFRVTRIRDIEVPGPTQDGEPLVERLIVDREGMRVPTPGEELRESFAQQPIMTESQARARGAELRRQEQETAKALERGLPVPEFERPPAFISGVLSRPTRAGGAVTETPLGAGIRGVLGTLENVISEGYFGALGYEVDEEGVPLDPDDFALGIKQFRDDHDIPDVVFPLEAAAWYVKQAHPVTQMARLVPDELADRVTPKVVREVGEWVSETGSRALRAIPQLALPTPGVATTRATRTPTAKDPEAKRTASTADAFFARVGQNVARGRSWGDDFRASPATAEAYAEVWGDPEAAWWGGTLGGMFVPVGPGVAAKLGSGIAGAATTTVPRALGLRSLTGVLIDKAEMSKGTSFLMEEGSLLSQIPHGAKQLAADLASAVSKEKVATARRLRQGARKVIRADVGLDDVERADALASITPQIRTLDDAEAALRGALGAADPKAPGLGAVPGLVQKIRLNVADDLVMVTENVAVPRAMAKQVSARVDELTREVFSRDPSELVGPLRAQAAEATNSRLARSFNDLADRIAEAVARGDGADARAIADGRQLRTTVEGLAREQGLDPAAAYQAARMRSPAEVMDVVEGGILSDIVEELGAYKAWSDIPVAKRQQFVEATRSGFAKRAARGEATTSDVLTDLQVFVEQAANPRLLDGRIVRNLRALFGQVQGRETVALLRAKDQIVAVARQAFRAVGDDLSTRVAKNGDVSRSLDEMLAEAPAVRAEPPDATWKRLFGMLYDEDPEVLWANASQLLPDIPPRPTVDLVADLDKQLLEKELLPGWDGLTIPSFVAAALTERAVQSAFLRTIMEEGARKGAASKVRDYSGFLTAATGEKRQLLLTQPVKRADVKLQDVEGVAAQVEYDLASSHLERSMAENGEEFANLVDAIPVSKRGELGFVDGIVGKGLQSARNALYGARYGYYLPNIPLLLGRVAAAPIISAVTIGLEATAKSLPGFVKGLPQALGGAVTESLPGAARGFLPDAWQARRAGAPIVGRDGIVYTGDDINELLDFHGLGPSALETERIGSLASDLLADAKRAAPTLSGVTQAATDALNPAARSYAIRMAEAIELSFRRAVFESALAGGRSPENAAVLARRSQFDFSKVPDVVRDTIGKYLATGSQTYSLWSEALTAVATNPGAYRTILRAQAARQRAMDPYQLYGDKSLTSLFQWETDSEDTYFGPTNPLFTPIGWTITAMQHSNIVLANLMEGFNRGLEGGGVGFVAESTGESAAQLVSELSAKVYAVADVIGGLDSSGSFNPSAVAVNDLSDEQVFYSTLMLADLVDPVTASGRRVKGTYKAVHAMLQPVYVNPPAGSGLRVRGEDGELEEHPRLWAQRPPEGTPLIRQTAGGESGFAVVKPSKEGIRNIRAGRAVPFADALGLGATVAMSFVSPEDTLIDARDIMPEGLEGAAATLFGTPAGPADVRFQRTRQAEALRALQESP